MSDKSRRWAYQEAIPIAEELKEALTPACEPGYIEIAGSLRRKSPTVGDIELLCVPRPNDPEQDILFYQDLLDAKIKQLLADGDLGFRLDVRGHAAYGPKNKLLVHTISGIPVDIFSAEAKNWGMALLVRTGPKELNIRLMTRLRQLGKQGHAYPTRGHKAYTDNQGVERDCPTEEDVFQALGWKFIEPEKRV